MDRIDELLEQSRHNVLRHTMTLSKRIAKPADRKAAAGRRRLLWSGAVIAGTLSVAGFGNPPLLNIGGAFNLLASRLFSQRNVRDAVLKGYSEKVSESATSQGITLTIRNVYADAARLEFGMIESFASGASSHPVIEDANMALNINGARKLYGFSGGQFQSVSGNRYAGVVYFPVMNMQPYRPLPATFVLHVHVGQIGQVRGDWNFSIPVSWQRQRAATRVFRPNAARTVQGDTLRVQSVSVGPVNTIIRCELIQSASARGGIGPSSIVRMLVTDQRGRAVGGPVASRSTSTLPNGERITEMTVTAASSSPETALTVTPFLNSPAHSVALAGHYPEALAIGATALTKVTGVEFLASETLVRLSSHPALLRPYHGVPLMFLELCSATGSAEQLAQMQRLRVSRTDPQGTVAVFPKLRASDSWTLESYGLVPEPGLTVHVPLPGLAPAHAIASSQYGNVQ